MGKVWVFAGLLTVLACAALYVLVFTKIAQKMFTKKNEKGIDK